LKVTWHKGRIATQEERGEDFETDSLVVDEDDENRNWGIYIPEKGGEIHVSEFAPEMDVTLLHELFHAIFDTTGGMNMVSLPVEECLVTGLSFGLIEALKRNPVLRDWVYEQTGGKL